MLLNAKFQNGFEGFLMLVSVIQQNPLLSAEAPITRSVTPSRLIASAGSRCSKQSCLHEPGRDGQQGLAARALGWGPGGPLSTLRSVTDQPCDLGQDTPISLFPLLPFACLNYLDCKPRVTRSVCSCGTAQPRESPSLG